MTLFHGFLVLEIMPCSKVFQLLQFGCSLSKVSVSKKQKEKKVSLSKALLVKMSLFNTDKSYRERITTMPMCSGMWPSSGHSKTKNRRVGEFFKCVRRDR